MENKNKSRKGSTKVKKELDELFEANTHDGIKKIAQLIIDNKDFRLSEKLQECATIYNRTAEILYEYANRGEMVKILVDEFGISTRHADTYIIKTQELLPLINPILKPEFYQNLIFTNLMQTRRTIIASKGDKNFLKALNDNDRNLLTFVKDVIPNQNKIDPKLLEPVQEVYTYDPKLITDNPATEEEINQMYEILDEMDRDDRSYDKEVEEEDYD